ncbi:NADPH2:quinone reductase [Bradyrhizobium sp. USDA 3686]|uniref:quinone oxidoreductase family protein n=1 Tax=Bradyrhizobium canariense TaxID=255045 RepID=UPI00195662A7|nr:quinone oxidoreductase [Bradyrhizobium canariense]MBM7486787.1 NADPH2:quinone reductase [Bradyrhizobium canariense]
MTKTIMIDKTGGPEVLQYRDVDVGVPGEAEVRIRQSAVGLNYIDVYQRTGLYPIPLPGSIGLEGAGVIEVLGPGVDNYKVGDRVAYAGGPPGAYAEARIMPVAPLVKLPNNIAEQQAAAIMLKGLTVQYLIRRTYRVKAGDTVLLHAAAGGVGLIACQWLRALGATVIGTVSTEEKAALAKAHGCTHTILYKNDKFVDRVRELTNGNGVPVVYDSVGKDTWEDSLSCLQPMGLMVSFGNTSGPVAPINIGQLAAKGSLFVTRPALATYTAKPNDLQDMARDLFEALAEGSIKPEISQTYPLKDAAQAHRDLESSKTVGSTVFTV